MSHLTMIQELVNDLGIMSLWQDTASTMEIIKLYDAANEKQLRIIEFGAGNGGWPVIVSRICNELPMIYAWESFQHTHYDFSIPTDIVYKNLTRNKQELLSLIDSKIDNHNIEVIDRYVNRSFDILDSDTTQYDIIRLDCLDGYVEITQLLTRIMKLLVPGGLLFIDDIDPIVCVNRFRAAMNYDDTGDLSLLWVGIKECAFQKPGGTIINQEQLKNILADRYNFSSVITCTDYSIPTKTYLRHCI